MHQRVDNRREKVIGVKQIKKEVRSMFGILNYVEGTTKPQKECYRSCAWFFVIEAEKYFKFTKGSCCYYKKKNPT